MSILCFCVDVLYGIPYSVNPVSDRNLKKKILLRLDVDQSNFWLTSGIYGITLLAVNASLSLLSSPLFFGTRG